MLRLVANVIAVAVASALAVVATAAGPAPDIKTLGDRPPHTYLWIGNSFFYYNNGLPSHVAGLAQGAAEKTPVRGTMVTIGGSGLDWHDVASYFRPNAIGSYVFDERNTIVPNTAEKKYDGAVLMDCSQCPIHPTLSKSFLSSVKADTDIVRQHGAVPVLFMSWAYEDKPEMTAQLAEAYTRAGNETQSLVIPAGLAFARALKARPDLKLHVADKRHPTLAGTYLAAATSYSALFNRPSEPNSYTAGLDLELARFLRGVAWATVQAYHDGQVTN